MFAEKKNNIQVRGFYNKKERKILNKKFKSHKKNNKKQIFGVYQYGKVDRQINKKVIK